MLGEMHFLMSNRLECTLHKVLVNTISYQEITTKQQEEKCCKRIKLS